METAIYNGSLIRPGYVIKGPAVVEEPETTIVLRPGQEIELNPYQTYVIRNTGVVE